MQNRYVKLIMVDENNRNKYYEMNWDGGSNFTVKYGRVIVTGKQIGRAHV